MSKVVSSTTKETSTEKLTDDIIRVIIIYKIAYGDSPSLAYQIRDDLQRSSTALI